MSVVSRRSVLLLAVAASACSDPPPQAGPMRKEYRYGDDARQVGELWLPPGEGRRSVVVLVHGGFWRSSYDRSLEDDVAADLVSAGFAVWNLEYRPVGEGGGWPQSFEDVAAGVDVLADLADDARLDLDRVVTVGHSAGGTLATWVAARQDARVAPIGACSQAGLLDLVLAAREGVGGNAVVDLMDGAPTQVPARYAAASPVERVPYGIPLLAVHGDADDIVPPSQSTIFVAAAVAAGDAADLVLVDDAGHFDHLDPSSRCWAAVRAWLDDVLTG